MREERGKRGERREEREGEGERGGRRERREGREKGGGRREGREERRGGRDRRKGGMGGSEKYSKYCHFFTLHSTRLLKL